MVCVPLDSTQHAWDQGCSQNRFVLSHGVDQFHGFDLGAKLSLGGFVAECHWNSFRIAGCRQPASQKPLVGFKRQVGSKSRPLRQCTRESVEAVMPRDFVKQILFARDIDAMARNFDGPAVVGVLSYVEAEPLKYAFNDCVFHTHSEKSLDLLTAKCRSDRRSATRIHVDHITKDRAAGHFLNQRSRAIARKARHFDIGTPFEPVGRLGSQTQRARRLSYGERIEICAFEKHILRRRRDFCFRPAHDTGNRNGAFSISDYKHGWIQLTFDLIQRRHLFIQIRAPHNDLLARECVRIECMQRLAKSEHDVVRHVSDIIYRPDPEQLETRFQPIRRRANLHPGYISSAIARAEIGI